MAKITAPVEDFNGEIAGVHFTKGTAETDNAAVISYCAGAGYKVEQSETGQELPDGALEASLQAALDSGETPSSVADQPTGNASKAEWHAYALTQGFTEEGLEGRTRDELRDLFND
jgi:hypothetical protein